MSGDDKAHRPTTLAYSALTGSVFVLLRNGTKRQVPEAELVTVIAGYLDNHHLMVTRTDGTKVAYVGVDLPSEPEAEAIDAEVVP